MKATCIKVNDQMSRTKTEEQTTADGPSKSPVDEEDKFV